MAHTALFAPACGVKRAKYRLTLVPGAQATQRKHNHRNKDQQLAQNIFEEQQNELRVLPFCLKYSASFLLTDTKQPLNFKRSAGTNMQQFTSCTQSSTVTFQSEPLTNHFKSRAHSVPPFSPSLPLCIASLPGGPPPASSDYKQYTLFVLQLEVALCYFPRSQQETLWESTLSDQNNKATCSAEVLHSAGASASEDNYNPFILYYYNMNCIYVSLTMQVKCEGSHIVQN